MTAQTPVAPGYGPAPPRGHRVRLDGVELRARPASRLGGRMNEQAPRRYPDMWVDPEHDPREKIETSAGEKAVLAEYLDRYRMTGERRVRRGVEVHVVQPIRRSRQRGGEDDGGGHGE